MLRNTARCLDALFVIAGALLAHWMRFDATLSLADTERLLIAFNCVLVLLLFPVFGIYETWRGKSLAEMLARVCAGWFFVVVTGLLLVFTLHRMDAVSRLWFGYSTLISGAMIVATKLAAHLMLRVRTAARPELPQRGRGRLARLRPHAARPSGAGAAGRLQARLRVRHELCGIR